VRRKTSRAPRKNGFARHPQSAARPILADIFSHTCRHQWIKVLFQGFSCFLAGRRAWIGRDDSGKDGAELAAGTAAPLANRRWLRKWARRPVPSGQWPDGTGW